MLKVRNWFNENKLSLNWDKTNYMIFSNYSKIDNVHITIYGVSINRVKEVKFLAVVLDEKLKWKAHIEYVKRKVSKSISQSM